MKIAIVGYRNFNDFDMFENYILDWELTNGKITNIISGGCVGTDKLAEKYAIKYNIPTTIHEAQWDKYGKSAGPIRDKKIVDDCSHLIAFLSSKSVGTKITINMAKKAGKDITIIEI